ncbi:hypothetical protein PFISCL1PPCAC_26285, partial [Pristionchus fissidentatus]
QKMNKQLNKEMAAIFDKKQINDRPEPEMPSIEGVEYKRAVNWSGGKLSTVLQDEQGRQLFR